MAKTFAELTTELETLKAKAEVVRKQEMAGVIVRIKEAISVYGLNAGDLGFDGSGSDRQVAPEQAASMPGSVKQEAARPPGAAAYKYRDGKGHAWTGRGPRPGWLKSALDSGVSLDALTIGGAVPEAASAASVGKRSPKSKKPASVAKYRDDAGHSWTGRGPTPKWLKDAVAGGKTLDELRT